MMAQTAEKIEPKVDCWQIMQNVVETLERWKGKEITDENIGELYQDMEKALMTEERL